MYELPGPTPRHCGRTAVPRAPRGEPAAGSEAATNGPVICGAQWQDLTEPGAEGVAQGAHSEKPREFQQMSPHPPADLAGLGGTTARGHACESVCG